MRFPLILLSLLGSLAVCHADAVRLIINGPNGKPVAGATVHAIESSGSGLTLNIENRFELQSDAAGRIAFESKKPLSPPAVPPTPTKTEMRRGSAPFSSLSAVVRAPNLALGIFNLKAGDTTVTLEQGRTLEGAVLDEAEKPVPNFNVELSRIALSTGDEPVAVPLFQKIKTQTDEQGRWRLEGLPSTGSVELRIAEADARFRGDSLWVEIVAPGQTPPLFVERGATVRGRLLKPDGSPAGGVRIYGGSASALPTTSAEGVFEITNADEEISFGAMGTVPFIVPRKTIANLRAGETRDIGDWKGFEGVHVRGKVVDAATKEPLKGVFVSASGEGYGRSDESGAFDFLTPPGSSSVSISADGYASQSKTALPAAQQGIIEMGTIALSLGYTASGTLLDQAGRPVQTFIIASPKDKIHGSELAQSSQGTFSFHALAPGSYTISSGARKLVTPISFEVGPNTPPPQLKLVVQSLPNDKPQTIRGRVFNGNQPVAGAKVRLAFEGYLSRVPGRTLVSNLDGSFSTTLALHGTTPKVVRVTRPGFVAAKGELKLENGVWRGDVALAKASDGLRGCVVDGAGRPVAGAFVALKKSTDLPIAVGAGGEFEMLGVPPAGVNLLVSDGPRFVRFKVEKDGEALQIVLQDAPPVADKTALAEEVFTSLSPAMQVLADFSDVSSERVEHLLRRTTLPTDTQWKEHLENLSERAPQTLIAREAELHGLVPPVAREELSFLVMRARASSPSAGEKAKVRAWLEQREQERMDVSVASISKTLELAAIAARLSPAEGTKWLEYAAQLSAQFPDGPDTYVVRKWGELAARIGPKALETLMQGWKPQSQLQLLLSALAYYGEYGDGANARKIFAMLETLASQATQNKVGFKGSVLYEKPADFVAAGRIELVRALASKAPAEALKLSSELGPYKRNEVLIEVAQGAIKLKQLDLARQVLDMLVKSGSVRTESTAKAAQIALVFDSRLAETLLSQSYDEAITSLSIFQSIAYYARTRATNWAGGSRIVLERELTIRQNKAQQDATLPEAEKFSSSLENYVVKDLAASMALFNPKRALELADQISDKYQRDEIRREVALVLLRSS